MTAERDSTMTLDELRDYFKRMEQVQESRRVCHNEFRAWHDAIDAHLSRKVSVSDDIVERLRVAARALIRERVVYAEDVETLVDVARVLESLASRKVAVPNGVTIPANAYPSLEAYADGWNACRQAMLASQDEVK